MAFMQGLIASLLTLCAFGLARGQEVWTDVNYTHMGRPYDVKVMANGDAWVARSGDDPLRRGPARYCSSTRTWVADPYAWNEFDSMFRAENPGLPRIEVNGAGQIVLGSRSSGMRSIVFYDGQSWSELAGRAGDYRNPPRQYRGASAIWSDDKGVFLISTMWDGGNVWRTGTGTVGLGAVESIKGNLPDTSYMALSASSLNNVLLATWVGLYRSANADASAGVVVWRRINPGRFNALYVASDEFAVVGGSNGAVGYWDGSGVTMLTTPFADTAINGVYGRSPDSIRVVGNGGLAQFWNGSEWSAMTLPNNTPYTWDLQAIHFNADGRGFIVGIRSGSGNQGKVWTTESPAGD